MFDLQTAQRMAGHSSPVVTMTYYTNEEKRQHERLMRVANNF
jgi:integrase